MTWVVPPAASIARTAAAENPCARTVSALVSSPCAEHLDQASLGDEAVLPQASRATPRTPASNASSVLRFTTWYSTRNGLVKPFDFGRPAVERGLATLEPGRHGVARALALAAPAGGLAALAADAATRPGAWRASSRERASGRGASLRSPLHEPGAGPGRASRGSRDDRADRSWNRSCPGRARGSCRGASACVPIVDFTSVTLSVVMQRLP